MSIRRGKSMVFKIAMEAEMFPLVACNNNKKKKSLSKRIWGIERQEKERRKEGERNLIIGTINPTFHHVLQIIFHSLIFLFDSLDFLC